MTVLVPFAANRPKTRLSDVLDREERASFARTMLGDVLDALVEADREPTVLATTDPDLNRSVDVEVDERDLTPAINARLAEGAPSDRNSQIAIVVADLALATATALKDFFETDGDVVIAPGMRGGTNAIVIREPSFRVNYHGASYRDHCRGADEIGAETTTVDSFRLAADIDEPADLVEALLHGEGRAATWLNEAGFSLVQEDGRVHVTRR